MTDDSTLLRRYAHEGSDLAFTEVVHRHVDFVYRVALRRTGGQAHHAADVTQQVFTSLARHAAAVARHPLLVAWLHTATRHAAANLMTSTRRRTHREDTAAALAALNDPASAPDWPALRALLDEALDDLAEADRAAIILRYLEQRPFAEVGAALRLSTDAARMRTERALGKLHSALTRRGITSTATALATALSTQPLVAAPAELATTLTSRALAIAHTSAVTAQASLASGLKLAAAFAAGGVLAFTAGLAVAVDYALAAVDSPPPAPPQTELIHALRRENLQLRTELDRRAATVSPTPAPASPPPLQPRLPAPRPSPTVIEVPLPQPPARPAHERVGEARSHAIEVPILPPRP